MTDLNPVADSFAKSLGASARKLDNGQYEFSLLSNESIVQKKMRDFLQKAGARAAVETDIEQNTRITIPADTFENAMNAAKFTEIQNSNAELLKATKDYLRAEIISAGDKVSDPQGISPNAITNEVNKLQALQKLSTIEVKASPFSAAVDVSAPQRAAMGDELAQKLAASLSASVTKDAGQYVFTLLSDEPALSQKLKEFFQTSGTQASVQLDENKTQLVIKAAEFDNAKGARLGETIAANEEGFLLKLRNFVRADLRAAGDALADPNGPSQTTGENLHKREEALKALESAVSQSSRVSASLDVKAAPQAANVSVNVAQGAKASGLG